MKISILDSQENATIFWNISIMHVFKRNSHSVFIAVNYSELLQQWIYN